jgi:hypothetical protein
MSETFTRRELDIAASRMGHIFSMNLLLAKAEAAGESSWDEEQLRRWLGYHCSWLTETVAEARRLREPSIANDDDVLTVGELRQAIYREHAAAMIMSKTSADKRTDKLMANIIAHREPEYTEGTIVTDAQGIQWKRSGAGWSRHGWSTDIFPLGEPRRPLKVT